MVFSCQKMGIIVDLSVIPIMHLLWLLKRFAKNTFASMTASIAMTFCLGCEPSVLFNTTPDHHFGHFHTPGCSITEDIP
jgi:hypothetical protein